MIVPDYWAESRKQQSISGKKVTVIRYGWSTSSQADAQIMAEQRATEALKRIIAGETLDRKERKVAYNGAEGMPIREEVLDRHGEEVITRNSYGAHCLNSPKALFADIDFSTEPSFKLIILTFIFLVFASVIVGMILKSWGVIFALLFASLLTAVPIAHLLYRLVVVVSGGAERIAHRRIVNFISTNPSWNIRLYRTPAGYRVLATHQPFEARDEEVLRFFTAVSTDPVYIRMCKNQNCFRARLTAKPWRIDISERMRPRPGIWPVSPESKAIRSQWVTRYEEKAASFAACRYIESLGSGVIHDSLKSVVDLHDRECRALVSGLHLA